MNTDNIALRATSAYYGSSRSEILNATNWNYDWKYLYMGAGNDVVHAQDPAVSYWFYGESGNDKFLGNDAGELVFGGDGNDYLNGNRGNDEINGGNNNDYLRGGEGTDELSGGNGRDKLYGGAEGDLFSFEYGDSNLKTSQVDLIQDWNANEDYINAIYDSATAQSYAERATRATTIEAARDQAEHAGSLTNKYFVFLYNHQKDRGFLLMDLDHDLEFDTGVVIRGAGSRNDMDYHDII